MCQVTLSCRNNSCQVDNPICSGMGAAIVGSIGKVQSCQCCMAAGNPEQSADGVCSKAGHASEVTVFSNKGCPIGLCRSKVGVAFDNKDEARKVRSGKYSLVDLDSFSSPPVSPGASKPKPKPKYAPAVSLQQSPWHLCIAGTQTLLPSTTAFINCNHTVS